MVVRKINEIEKFVEKKLYERYVCLGFGLDCKMI